MSTDKRILFCQTTANNFVTIKSVINIGDTIIISSNLIDSVADITVLVLDMSIVLNNTRIFPTELTILFKFRDLGSEDFAEYLITQENFKYVKHIKRFSYGVSGE